MGIWQKCSENRKSPRKNRKLKLKIFHDFLRISQKPIVKPPVLKVRFLHGNLRISQKPIGNSDFFLVILWCDLRFSDHFCQIPIRIFQFFWAPQLRRRRRRRRQPKVPRLSSKTWSIPRLHAQKPQFSTGAGL